jgi:hypothetical protein
MRRRERLAARPAAPRDGVSSPSVNAAYLSGDLAYLLGEDHDD